MRDSFARESFSSGHQITAEGSGTSGDSQSVASSPKRMGSEVAVENGAKIKACLRISDRLKKQHKT